MARSKINLSVLHISETLVVSGCCRVMEHLALNSSFESIFCAGAGDAVYMKYLQSQGIQTLLLDDAKIQFPKNFVAVLHRSGNGSPFWDRVIAMLREAGAKAIIERNIFGYVDTQKLSLICANSMNTLWHHWRQSGKPPIENYLTHHRVLYNAVSFSPTRKELAILRTEWRNKLGIAEGNFVMGIVTRPDPNKIDAVMLGLITKIRSRVPNFVLITRCYPPALAAIFKKLMGDRYHNLPVMPDAESLKATYAMMDVCGNFPSIGESFGMSMAEAMRSYNPVIALDMPDKSKGNSQRELIEHNVTGFLCSSPADIVRSIAILAKNPALCEQMGVAAHHKMTTAPFALSSVIAQFEAEVKRAMGEADATPILPDASTIKTYLETYPAKLPQIKQKGDDIILLRVALVRLGWKIWRKYL